ncbi:hypothetical protein pipiens_016259 [Culex pipiens pipiens]|uniref:C-type lectin domain-containing protein n=1 Tax=Culex pipiens pipiens TaxID=38569 RepID=A0ABD1CM69_CULPP
MKEILICSLLVLGIVADEVIFEVPNFMANWHGANLYCTTRGSSLVTVTSLEKHEALVKFLEKSDKKYNNEGYRFWIGASSLPDGENFVWQSTGSRLSFTKWNLREPNNAGGVEQCVEIIYCPTCPRIWDWNDMKCSLKAYFVCETVDDSHIR